MQSTLPVLLGCGLGVERVAELTAQAPAQRFGLTGKGELRVGHDADLVLVDVGAHDVLQARELHHRWPGTSPYAGERLRGRVVSTWLGGVLAYHGGHVNAQVRGRLLRPVPS